MKKFLSMILTVVTVFSIGCFTGCNETESKFKVGEYITFGYYEQDLNKRNEIEWLVLEVKHGKALLISRYALDCQPYNSKCVDVTWETCTLRQWLNIDFINAAFSDNEKARILTVPVSADKNPNYSTNPGNVTKDKIFLLSVAEVNKYFSNKESRKCARTAYAAAQGAYTDFSYKTENNEYTCVWWLRTPGIDQNTAVMVQFGGDILDFGHLVHHRDYAVRPAMWISTN